MTKKKPVLIATVVTNAPGSWDKARANRVAKFLRRKAYELEQHASRFVSSGACDMRYWE